MRKSTLLLPLIFALAACTASIPGDAATPTSTLEASGPAVCTVQSEDVEADKFPATSEEDWVKGAEKPLVTLIEYSDFQCPFCALFDPILNQLVEKFPDELQVVYRHFPLTGTPENPFHDKAALATQAAEAAGLQDMFWEMHDLLFEKQADWVDLSPEEFEDWLLDEADELGLDAEQFAEDLVSDEMVTLAEDAWNAGLELEMTGTPTVVIQGYQYNGALDFNSLSLTIELVGKLEGIREMQYDDCPPMNIDPLKEYYATLHTEKGDIVIKLWPDIAPFAVNSFIFLAEHDWYDNVTFHRVIEGFVAQGGDPSGTGAGNPGYLFSLETSPEATFDRPGLFAMANSGPTANGSQFFITYSAQPGLNGRFTIFGEVVEGMDVLESLTQRDPSANPDAPPGDLILDVTIEVR